jgi:hypothetical protein
VSPRTTPAHELPPVLFDAAECAGCGAETDPDCLCGACRERREEYGEHDTRCMCDGCRWYRTTDAKLRAWGVR